MKKTGAVLFARSDSHYKALFGTDVWDIERDARKWPGGAPVVAHPPCRAWGRLRQFAKPRKGERLLATWSVRQVRQWGGLFPFISTGGATRPRNRVSCTSWGVSLPTSPRSPIGWMNLHTSCRAERKLIAARISASLSASTLLPNWQPGWSSWLEDALGKCHTLDRIPE